MKKTEISVLLGLVLCVILTLVFQTNLTAQNIRNETLRLHVIAQSNSSEDQEIKLLVRDTIIDLSHALYKNENSINEVIDKTLENTDYLTQVINYTLEKNGIDYTASVNVEDFYFETVSYENFTLPQGEYKALTVRLGEAQGKNWWCVLYPSFCLQASSVEYKDEESNEFITEDITIKFKAVEVYEDIVNFLKDEEKEVYDKL